MTDIEKAEYDDVVRQLMARCEQLAAENAKLRSEKSDAMSVVKEIYNDVDASPALRLKAAGLALPHEVPKLMPERAPLELTVAAADDPDAGLSLAELVEKRRKRCRAIQALPLEQRSRMVQGITRDGNGSDDDTAAG
jgi:hypothetical protein